MSSPQFTPVELEIVGLKTLTDSLDSLINHEILTLRGSDPKQ